MYLFVNYKPEKLKAPTLTIIDSNTNNVESIKLFGSDPIDYLNGLAKYITLYKCNKIYTNSEKFKEYMVNKLADILVEQYNYTEQITIDIMEN